MGDNAFGKTICTESMIVRANENKVVARSVVPGTAKNKVVRINPDAVRRHSPVEFTD